MEDANGTGSKAVPRVNMKASDVVESNNIAATKSSNDVETSRNNSEKGELSNEVYKRTRKNSEDDDFVNTCNNTIDSIERSQTTDDGSKTLVAGSDASEGVGTNLNTNGSVWSEVGSKTSHSCSCWMGMGG
jgi:hypothetical protein